MASSEHTGKKSQPDRFREAARELGCDESEERFDAALVKVARHKPKGEGEKPKAVPKKTR